MRGDHTLVPIACYLDEDGDGSSVVHMMSYRERYQYRSVEVQPHSITPYSSRQMLHAFFAILTNRLEESGSP